MSRNPVALRDATVADTSFLIDIWQDSLRPASGPEQEADVERIIVRAQESPEQRLVIAEYHGRSVGAVFLQATTVSPIYLEPTVRILAPHVLPEVQRKGIGIALMDAGVDFAEELGIGHVAAAAHVRSRDGNRYLARLGFGPQGVYRTAATAIVRAAIDAQRPAAVPGRVRSHLSQVLAARRSMKRREPVG